MLKLSIITINLNNREGLEKTIESVACQSAIDLEYIVIDGGSTDGSVDIIKQYADKITYWVSEPDKGIYNAMNKGIVRAKGEYCLFLNSGDYLFEKSVLKEMLSHKLTEDIVYGNLQLSDGITVLKEKKYPDSLKFSYFFYESLPHPAALIKRSLFDIVGFYNESYQIISDWAFFVLAIGKYSCTWKHIPIIVSVFDMNGLSSSYKYNEVIALEKKSFLRENFSFFIQDIEELSDCKNELSLIKYSRIYKAFVKIRKLIGKGT